MPNPRVIIVETDHKVSDSLRANLQYSGLQFTIIDAPSGEEALLELGRGGIDLLVTSLELPGISGLELLEKARKQNPETRSIIVTGNPTQEAQNKAHALGVIAFLRKPIRTSHFLAAVSRALELQGFGASEGEKEFVAESLMSMQRELGAEATFLLNASGEVVVEAGELDAVDLRSALPSLLNAFDAGIAISGLLETEVPANFMYFDGDRYDVYLASVGADHALVIVFPAKQGAKQIGAVLQYSRKAAKDLVSGLYSVGEVKVSASNGDEKQDPGEEPAIQDVSEPDLESAADGMSKQDAEQYWDEATEKPGDTGPIDETTLSYEEARKRGLLEDPES
jgi:DNA-binding response OmpR family regulator